MNHTFSAPVTAAQRQRDTLLGALVGLALAPIWWIANKRIRRPAMPATVWLSFGRHGTQASSAQSALAIRTALYEF